MPQPPQAAIDRLISYAMDTDIFHIHASKCDFHSFNEWMHYVLADTAYGAAILVSSMSADERLSHLRALWSDEIIIPMEQLS
jgi:hypothetical protein